MTALLILLIVAWMVWALSKKDPLKEQIRNKERTPYNISLEIELEEKYLEELTQALNSMDKKTPTFDAIKELFQKYQVQWPTELLVSVYSTWPMDKLIEYLEDDYNKAEFDILADIFEITNITPCWKFKDELDRNKILESYYTDLREIDEATESYYNSGNRYWLSEVRRWKKERPRAIKTLKYLQTADKRKLTTKVHENESARCDMKNLLKSLVTRDLATKGYRHSEEHERGYFYFSEHPTEKQKIEMLRKKYRWYKGD